MSSTFSSSYRELVSDDTQRLLLAVLLAVAFHTLLILGIRFTILPEKSDRGVLSLNITLMEKPGNAPTLGSITEPNELEPVEPQPSQPPAPPVENQVTPKPDPEPEPKLEPKPEPKPDPEPVISQEPAKSTTPKQAVTKPVRAPTPSPPPARAPSPRPTSKPSGAELRNLGLQMARQTQLPDPKTLRSQEKDPNSPSTTTLEKFYKEDWTRKVEQIGNLNFPEEARRLNLSKGPVLAVVIRADGTLKSIRIVRSSGHTALDQAATQIVRLAAPYSPFPPELRRYRDMLEIVRRWQFERGRMSGR